MTKSFTIKSLCLMVALVSFGISSNAQLTHLEQSVYLNLNLPGAQFGSDASRSAIPLTRSNIGREAIAGMGIGYRASYRFDVGFGEVSPYINVDFNWNRTSGDFRDQYIDADGSSPNYFNLPIFVGVNYRYQLTDVFTPFAEFGLGPDFMFVTKESGNYLGSSFKLRYKTSGNFAFQFGIGSYFGEHVSAGIHYSGYGKHVIKYTNGTDVPVWVVALEDADDFGKTSNRNIGLWSLRIGFHF